MKPVTSLLRTYDLGLMTAGLGMAVTREVAVIVGLARVNTSTSARRQAGFARVPQNFNALACQLLEHAVVVQWK